MLTSSHPYGPRPFRLRAVLFDFDGTLTRPDALDFAAIKRELGCPPDAYVLEWIETLPGGRRRDAALAALERFELEGADESVPNDGAEDLVRRLRNRGLKVGLHTRNARRAVERALRRFPALGPDDFDVIVTRGDGLAPKPAADGVLHAAAIMGVAPSETLVVGDYVLDVLAGRAAGAVTVYLANGDAGADGDVDAPGHPRATDCDYVVSRLAELEDVVRLGLPLLPGKLPNDLLAGHLDGLSGADPALIVPPAVGEDVAALTVGGAEVLVAHSDPITLGGTDRGRAAVLVNANDIASSGAEPRWLLSTVLLPPGSTPSQALHLLRDLARAAEHEGITVAGGHTEITPAVVQPIVSVTMFGTLRREDLRDKRSVRAGERAVLTKALALEGTALLAEELGERLRALGMSEAELASCRDQSTLTSIVPEARVATRCAAVRAMHDVTEGGLAMALRELAVATGHAITVSHEQVSVAPLTRRVCDLLEADPLGLIASGSLLICCAPEGVAELLTALDAAGIAAHEIGEVGGEGAGVAALRHGRPAPWPWFATDEAARLLAET